MAIQQHLLLAKQEAGTSGSKEGAGLPSRAAPGRMSTSSAFNISEVLDINYLPEAEAPDIA